MIPQWWLPLIERWKDNILLSATVCPQIRNNMSRRVLEYMLQMSTVLSKAFSDRMTLEPWWHCREFESLLEAQRAMSLLPYDLHKCHKFQTSWPTWKSDSCLEICWSWTSFWTLLEQSGKTSFRNVFTQKMFCSIDQGIIRLFFA